MLHIAGEVEVKVYMKLLAVSVPLSAQLKVVRRLQDKHMFLQESLPTSKGTLILRNSTAVDAPSLKDLRLEALSLHPEVYAVDYESAARQDLTWWGDRLTERFNDGKEIICIAESNGELVGMAGIFRGRWPNTIHSATVWGVYVKPEWRGLHIAERLIRLCLSWGKEQGVTIAKIAVIAENTSGLRCYKRCGFVEYGVEPGAILYNGIHHDEVLLALDI